MPLRRDTDDTADFPFDAGAAPDEITSVPEDTDEIDLARAAASAQAELASRPAHPFAQGIIRFYRARTLLLDEQTESRCRHAWGYLSRLRPHDLPPSVRRDFFELVYFMHEQTGRPRFEAEVFVSRVLSIASTIDGFVDEINLAYDR